MRVIWILDEPGRQYCYEITYCGKVRFVVEKCLISITTVQIHLCATFLLCHSKWPSLVENNFSGERHHWSRIPLSSLFPFRHTTCT